MKQSYTTLALQQLRAERGVIDNAIIALEKFEQEKVEKNDGVVTINTRQTPTPAELSVTSTGSGKRKPWSAARRAKASQKSKAVWAARRAVAAPGAVEKPAVKKVSSWSPEQKLAQSAAKKLWWAKKKRSEKKVAPPVAKKTVTRKMAAKAA